jgi:hydroxysqualene dehydroxylase
MRSSDMPTVHIIGAGLAGLAAAVRLADSGRAIIIHEAANQPGGRCRSYHDRTTGLLIDNGTHLLLSGNKAALSYAKTIGSDTSLQGPVKAEYPFHDLASDETWVLGFGDGRLPWWVFDKDRRVPHTSAIDYFALARLAWASADKPIAEVMDCSGPIYERMLAPFLLAALNIAPRKGSAKLAAALIRETLALGGQACRPLLARNGIGKVFVEPAIAYLQQYGISIAFEDELHSMQFNGACASQLNFAGRHIDLGQNDAVILAVPPYVAAKLVPNLRVPSNFCGIVNAHFRTEPPRHMPAMLGVINGTCQWIFALPGRISVTISDAGTLLDKSREELAQTIWRDVAKIGHLSEVLPPWQIVRERRATFAATPEQNVSRPEAKTTWSNLFLAGDWTATGLPATLESAVRSGYHAADLTGHWLRVAA